MERERRRAEERMTLRHEQRKWSKGMKDSGKAMWDEEAQNGTVEMTKRSEEPWMRISGKAILGEDEELESGGHEEEDDLFNEDHVSYPKDLQYLLATTQQQFLLDTFFPPCR
ncbi:hypothetical protein B9Z19DRAFT_1118415 [Tuber borchii]|uniref:Uncharacterized protein n=1 Tax=Tuber borchii TaxID=42251 RepID=A0A2T7A8P7_TUBBO|nr:hypothetical protein B9Z19DRAFT_1118415 [Tuber borchii]